MGALPAPTNLLEALNGMPLPQSQDLVQGGVNTAQGRNGTSLVMHGRIWQVGSGATTTSIPILDSNGLPVLMSASMQALYTNAKFEIIQAGIVELAVVTAVGASGTLTLDSPLSSAPSAGTAFLLTPAWQTSLTGSKVINPTLIDTIAFGSFTASSNLFKTYSGVLSRGAKSRVFIVKNSLNQPLTSLKIYIQDSIAYVGGNINGDTFTASTAPVASVTGFYGSYANPSLVQSGDSFGISLGMGATAPTTGNLLIYVGEVM